jgi:PEGA domain
VTTGAPLYLVSACASAEEFVAAFRRYADRAGLFVPIADPLPQGRRGRIAVTLSDGRIVLEGEIEVATSSARPSPLYGRVGMTLKFVEPDAPTKTTLAELEKARLAMKPPPLSVAPRSPSTDVPAQPRPAPPPVGGRIDAANALAETIAIGELAAWRDGAAPKPTTDSPSSKFVIPTIPQVGAPRPRTSSVPPALQPKMAPDPKPPPLPGTTPVAIPPKLTPPIARQAEAIPIAVSSKATSMGMPAIDRLPGVELVEEVAKPAPAKKTPPKGTSMGMPAIERLPGIDFVAEAKPKTTTPPKGTSMGMPALRDPAAVVAAAPSRRDPTPIPKRGDSISIPVKREVPVGKQTTLGMPIVRAPADLEKTDLGPITIEAPAPPPPTSTGAARRAHTPSTPPAPRQPTPYTPLPIVRKPAELAADLSETTERTTIPEPPPVGEDQKKTSLGVSMMSASPVETGWDESGPAYVGPPPSEVAGRSGGLRASEIMSAMKGEDWVMTPDASQPTIVPKSEPAQDPNVKAAEEKSGPAVGDWAISLDPQAPGGWSAPSKVEKLPEVKQSPSSGNRNIAVASSQAIEAVEWEEKPTGIGQALVEIDPTLMGSPVAVTEVTEDEEPVNIVSTPVADVPPPQPFALSALPLAAKTPSPPPLFALPPTPQPAASDSFPAFAPRADPADVMNFAQDPTDSIPGKRKRRVIAVAIAAVVAIVATILVIAVTGGKKTTPGHALAGSGSAITVADAATAIVVPDKGSAQELAAVDAGVAAPAVCNVEVSTTPTGAEISLDKTTVVGTSPATIPMPCGVETKIYVKKAKYGNAMKAFTATADATKVAIKIAAPIFQLKVTSMPEGATITIAGKVVGITPTSIKVTAFTSTMITLTKDGYTPDTQKIAPRVNNAAHHVVMKHITKKLR